MGLVFMAWICEILLTKFLRQDYRYCSANRFTCALKRGELCVPGGFVVKSGA
jgi:hypothetical protein